MAPSVRAVLRRLRRAAVPVVVAAALAVVGVVFRDRIVDWFAGRGGVGDWSTPVRGKAGALAVDLSLVPNPPRQNGNHVRVELSDAAGEPTDAEVKVTYDMAAMGAMPEMKGVVTVRRRAKGRFEGGFDLPIGGGWGLIVDVTTGSKTSTARYSFTVGAPGVLALDGDDSEPAGDSMAGMPGMGSGDSMAGTPGMGGGAATPTAAPSYPPAALTALRGGLDAYARVSSGLAAGLVDQESAGRLALALRDAGKALGHASDNTSAALDASARAADAIAATSDVATARKAFADLNRAVVAVMAADPRVAGDWKLFECPMAPNYKRWFQREPAPTNPYLGREMSKCVSEVPWTAAVPTATAAGDTGEIKIDAERRQVIGLRTDKVVKAPMTLDIRAVGRVTYDETRLTDVTLRVGGFITDLRVAATGRAVKKGETLFTLYSPELYANLRPAWSLLALVAAVGVATADDAAPLPDPLTMDDAVVLARANRAEILAARARTDAAAERPAIVSALEDPTVSASIDHLPFMLSGVDGSLVVEQRFPLSRVRRHRRLAAEADARRLDSDVDRVALDVELEAATAFVMLREERQMAGILAERKLLADQVVAAATARYAAGKGMQAEVLRAELDAARIDGEIAAKTAEISAAGAMLNTSLGRPPELPLPALADGATDEPPSSVDVVRAAIDGRPELRGGRADIERANAEISVMNDMYRPMAMVQTGPSYTMADGPGWMVMVGVSVPVWRDKLRAGVAEARSMATMASEDLVAMQRMVAGDAAVARERVVAARARWLALRDQVVPRARAAVEPTIAGYTSGDLPLVSVLEMVDELTMARMELARAEREVGEAWARLDRAMGGGRAVGAR